jgi:hypothetical protein
MSRIEIGSSQKIQPFLVGSIPDASRELIDHGSASGALNIVQLTRLKGRARLIGKWLRIA